MSSEIIVNLVPFNLYAQKFPNMKMIARKSLISPERSFIVNGLNMDKNYKVSIHFEMLDGIRLCISDGINWIPSTKNKKIQERHVTEKYFHPNGEMTGFQWMDNEISFDKLKITNNQKDVNGNDTIFVKTFHKYQPILTFHSVDSNESTSITVSSAQFIPVTVYQRKDMGKWKSGQSKYTTKRNGGFGKLPLDKFRASLNQVAPIVKVAPVPPIPLIAPNALVAPGTPVAQVDPIPSITPIAPISPVARAALADPFVPIDPNVPVAPPTPDVLVPPIAPIALVAPSTPNTTIAPIAPVPLVVPADPFVPFVPIAPINPIVQKLFGNSQFQPQQQLNQMDYGYYGNQVNNYNHWNQMPIDMNFNMAQYPSIDFNIQQVYGQYPMDNQENFALFNNPHNYFNYF